MIKVLALIGKLLDYPTPLLCAHKDELVEAMQSSPHLPPQMRRNLMAHIDRELSRDIYDLQVRYDGLFDRGRSLSLLLFEHVHGESRDRGQAMVDLLNVYLDAGMQPRADELPDYLPLFLEFLSTQDAETAVQWLFEVSQILQLLAERLRKRQAWEAELFEALLVICGSPLGNSDIADKVAAEADDTTLAALDKAWEDKEIRFDTQLQQDHTWDHAWDHACPKTLERASELLSEQPVVWQPLNRKSTSKEV